MSTQTTTTGRASRYPYEIRIPAWGIFRAKDLPAAGRRAARERSKAAKHCGGAAPHAAIYRGTELVDYII